VTPNQVYDFNVQSISDIGEDCSGRSNGPVFRDRQNRIPVWSDCHLVALCATTGLKILHFRAFAQITKFEADVAALSIPLLA
jgi:hypothetical protein